MKLRGRYKIYHYNIGFINSDISNILKDFNSLSIHWMKHKYKDRMFADPFLLNIDEDTIDVLAEESIFLHKASSLVKLTISKKDFHLKRRKVILHTKKHLSYPYIIRNQNNIFLLPEHIASGKLDLYHYDEKKEICTFVKTIIEVPISDPCIYFKDGTYWLFGSKKGTDQEELYLWQSPNIWGEYTPKEGVLIKKTKKGSRMAGEIFTYNDKTYRPSQDCESHYGAGTIIWEIKNISQTDYQEQKVKALYPTNTSPYPNGLHTINFKGNWCVIDGMRIQSDFWRGGLIRLSEKLGLNLFDH